jgi:hypothetical protein
VAVHWITVTAYAGGPAGCAFFFSMLMPSHYIQIEIQLAAPQSRRFNTPYWDDKGQ